jgi:hypothetical protein
VGERNFTGKRHGAADRVCVGDGVVSCTEKALGEAACRPVEHLCDGVNLGGLQSFFKRDRCEEEWQTLGEHHFAGTGRANH